MSEPKAAQFVCEHAYGTRLLGGHPIAVRSCALCHRPDWDDLYREAEALFRWGWQEGAAGKPPREKLSSYDRPKEGGLQLLACSLAHCRQAHPAHSWEPQPGMSPVHCGGSSGDPAATWSPQPCGRTVPHLGHKFMRGRAAHQCPGVEQQTDLAADVECAIGLNTGDGGADGVYAARDAVLAVRDQELERLRARLNRVQVIADRLAAQGRLGVDLEADSIRRGIAQQLHDALDATPKAPEESP